MSKVFFNQKAKYHACTLLQMHLLPSGKAGYFTYDQGWDDEFIADMVGHGASAGKVEYLRKEVFGELWVAPKLTDAEKIIALEKEVTRLKAENDDLSWGFAVKSGHPSHTGHVASGATAQMSREQLAQGALNFAG
jgi:hypothetical protein